MIDACPGALATTAGALTVEGAEVWVGFVVKACPGAARTMDGPGITAAAAVALIDAGPGALVAASEGKGTAGMVDTADPVTLRTSSQKNDLLKPVIST